MRRFVSLALANFALCAYVSASAAQVGDHVSSQAPQVVSTPLVTTGFPITTGDHFRRFTNAVFSLETLVAPAVTAGASQLMTSHAGFGSDWNGYGQHYGVNVLASVSGKFVGKFVLPAHVSPG
jgi:hypothetical protein